MSLYTRLCAVFSALIDGSMTGGWFTSWLRTYSHRRLSLKTAIAGDAQDDGDDDDDYDCDDGDVK